MCKVAQVQNLKGMTRHFYRWEEFGGGKLGE